MVIYVVTNGSTPCRAFRNITNAEKFLDSQMFELCKLGHRINTFKSREYIYSHPKENTQRALRIVETELQE